MSIDVGVSGVGVSGDGATTPGRGLRDRPPASSSAPPLLGEPVEAPGANDRLRFERRAFRCHELALFAEYMTTGGQTAPPTQRARLPLAALLMLLHSAGRTCFPTGTLCSNYEH